MTTDDDVREPTPSHLLHPVPRVAGPLLFLGLDLPAPVDAPGGARHDLDEMVGALPSPRLGQDGLDISKAVGVGKPEDNLPVHLSDDEQKMKPFSFFFFSFFPCYERTDTPRIYYYWF